MAAPALIATLLADLVLGFLGKASPQLPVLFLGLSVKSMVGLCGAGLIAEVLAGNFRTLFHHALFTPANDCCSWRTETIWRTATRPNRQHRGGGKKPVKRGKSRAAASWPERLIGFAGLLVAVVDLGSAAAAVARSDAHLDRSGLAKRFQSRHAHSAWTATGGAALDRCALRAGMGAGRASSVAQGGFVFAAEALTPNLERMSPAKKLGQMFSLAGLAPVAKSLVPFSVLLYLGIYIWRAIGNCCYAPARCRWR